ncbi:MAG: glycosyltransferase family 4 protein [Patescibacteria group bacterium]
MEPKINQKRVLFVITQSEFGGAQRFLYELATRLDKEKYEILVASGEQKDKFLEEALKEKNIKTKKLRFLKRKINPIFDCLGIMELMKLINSFKPDYLHLNSSKAGFLGSIAGFKIRLLKPKKFKKLKIIYRIGGWTFNDPWPWWKKRTFIMAEKMTAKLKDIIVVNNKSDYEQALKLKIKPKKELKLIYNGIDALKIDFLPRDEARLKLKINKGDFVVGTIANFYPTKGFEYLIDAAQLLKNSKFQNTNPKSPVGDLGSPIQDDKQVTNSKFLIIGDGIERPNLESRIRDYGLEKEVILLGQIPEASRYMKAFDIFVLPSVKEGFPWTVLDAMAAKVPVVATDVGALPEIIENGENGVLVQPKNPNELAEAIRYLAKNERNREELAFEAHQTVLFKFPVEKMVREIEVLFE